MLVSTGSLVMSDQMSMLTNETATIARFKQVIENGLPPTSHDLHTSGAYFIYGWYSGPFYDVRNHCTLICLEKHAVPCE